MDSECVVCGKMTEYFCDGCESFVCENHGHNEDKIEPRFFCEKCIKENKKPKIAKKGLMLKGLR